MSNWKRIPSKSCWLIYKWVQRIMPQSQYLVNLSNLQSRFSKELDLSMKFKTIKFQCFTKFGRRNCIKWSSLPRIRRKIKSIRDLLTSSQRSQMMFEMTSYSSFTKSKNFENEFWCFSGLILEERRSTDLWRFLNK